LEFLALLEARKIEKEFPEPPLELTEEQKTIARKRIRERLANRPANPPSREETKLDILHKRIDALAHINSTLVLHFSDLCREIGIPTPQNPADFDPRVAVCAARGGGDSYIREWRWDSELRKACDTMRDGLGVEQFGPFYDSDNHEWVMVAIGGNHNSQRVLDIIAMSHQVSPTACIRSAFSAYLKTA